MFRVFRASELEHSNLKEKGGKSLSIRNKTFPFGNSYSQEEINLYCHYHQLATYRNFFVFSTNQ